MQALEKITKANRLIHTIPMKEIRLVSDHSLLVDGVQTKVSRAAKSELMSLINFTQKTTEAITDSVGSDVSVDLINTVLKTKKSDATLVFDGTELSRIVKPTDKGIGISPEDFVRKIEFFMSQKDDFVVRDIRLNRDNTKAVVNIMDSQERKLTVLGEDVNVGTNLEWDLLGGTSVADYVNRLVCNNGAVRRAAVQIAQLNSASSAEEWYNALFSEVRLDKIQQDYDDRLLIQIDRRLSLREFLMVQKHLNSVYTDDRSKIAATFGDNSWLGEYEARGIDVKKLSAEQARFAPTPVEAWPAINLLTDLATHNGLSQVTSWQRHETQRFAGRLIDSTPDSKVWIQNLPSFN